MVAEALRQFEGKTAIAVLAIAAVLLNWLTTGDHLGRRLTYPHLTAIASMDLVLLSGAALSMLAAARLGERSSIDRLKS